MKFVTVIPTPHKQEFVYRWRQRSADYWGLRLCDNDLNQNSAIAHARDMAGRLFGSEFNDYPKDVDQADADEAWKALCPLVDSFCSQELLADAKGETEFGHQLQSALKQAGFDWSEAQEVLRATLAAFPHDNLEYSRQFRSIVVQKTVAWLSNLVESKLKVAAETIKVPVPCSKSPAVNSDWMELAKNRFRQKYILKNDFEDDICGLFYRVAENVCYEENRTPSPPRQSPFMRPVDARAKLRWLCKEILNRPERKLNGRGQGGPKGDYQEFAETKDAVSKVQEHLSKDESTLFASIFDFEKPHTVKDLAPEDSLDKLRFKVDGIVTGALGLTDEIYFEAVAKVRKKIVPEPTLTCLENFIILTAKANLPRFEKRSKRAKAFPLRPAVVTYEVFEKCYPNTFLEQAQSRKLTKKQVVESILNEKQATCARWIGPKSRQPERQHFNKVLRNSIERYKVAFENNDLLQELNTEFALGLLLYIFKFGDWSGSSRRQALCNWWIDEKFHFDPNELPADPDEIKPLSQKEAHQQLTALLEMTSKDRSKLKAELVREVPRFSQKWISALIDLLELLERELSFLNETKSLRSLITDSARSKLGEGE